MCKKDLDLPFCDGFIFGSGDSSGWGNSFGGGGAENEELYYLSNSCVITKCTIGNSFQGFGFGYSNGYGNIVGAGDG
jgi:hypothetical protein